mgnify:CR=1 FL=1
MPLETNQEKRFLEDYCERKYKTKLTKDVKESIFKTSAGHFEIYKMMYKAEITNNDYSLQSYITRLVNSMGDDILNIIRKKIQEAELSSAEENIIRLFEAIGFFREDRITIPILKEEILRAAPKVQAFIQGYSGEFIIPRAEIFSKSEITILKTLYKQSNKLVTRDELITELTELSNSSSSDWAIDQSIYRIRNKIDKYNLNILIETVHGKGWKLREI